MEIVPLHDFNFLLSFKLTGYCALTSYRVVREENVSGSIFKIEKYKREQPYCKVWPSMLDDKERLTAMLEQDLSFGLLENGQLVAICVLEHQVWNNLLYIEQIEVLPDLRGHGLGALMLAEVQETAVRLNARAISLETQNTNGEAIDFYRKNGFSIEGFDLSFYTNTDLTDGEVAVFMKKMTV